MNTKKNIYKDSSLDSSDNKDYLFESIDDKKAIEKIFELLFKYSEVDFSKYRKTTIFRRINRRMNLLKQDSYPNYLVFLEKESTEIEILFQDLLLSYTHFFRDKDIFELLKKKVFPELVKNHSTRKPIRIWIPGCSTGEEVYSMAICLFEFMEQSNLKVPLQFFGTDLVEKNITKARTGLYGEKIRENVSKERLARFFDQTPNGLKVIKHIREMCVFAEHDITQDPPFPYIDMISCRNVMIYFDENLQNEAIPRFHFSLNLDGFLLLGSSEEMGRFTELFNIYDKKSNLFSKRITNDKPTYSFPVTRKFYKSKTSVSPVYEVSQNKTDKAQLSTQINKIIHDTYAPPGVLVNDKMIILQFIGDTHPYIAPENGVASLKLSNMAGNDLMPDIFLAIEEAKKKNVKIRKNGIHFKQNKQIKTVDLSIIPIKGSNEKEINFLILFEKIKTQPSDSLSKVKKNTTGSDRADKLEIELQKTKEHLRLIVEEKDEANYDLWAANEEIMSTNEELQSVNEEMEAAKEELESGNEELIALNEELRTKNQEISESEEKYRSLIERANDGICIIQDGSVKFANPHLLDIWGGTINEIVGRSFTDFVHPDEVNKLEDYYGRRIRGEMVPSIYETVLISKNKSTIIAELSSGIINYQGSPANFIIVRDVTERKQMEAALLKSERKNKEWIANSPICTKILDLDFNLQFMSDSGVKELEIADITQFYGKPYPLSFYPDSFKITMRKNLERAKETGETIIQEAPIHDLNGNTLWYHSSIIPVYNEQEQLDYMMVVSMDTTKRKQAEEDLIENEKLLQSIADNYPNSYVSIIDKDYKVGFASGQEFSKQRLDPKQFVGLTVEQIYADDAKFVTEKYQKTFQGEEQEFHLFINNQYQHYRTVPLYSGDGNIFKILSVVENITERKLAQTALIESEEKFAKAFNLNPNTLAIIDINTLERIEVNDYFAEVVGYSKKELLKAPLGSLGEIDLEKVNLALETVRKGNSIQDVEVNLTSKNGETRVMLYAVEELKIGDRDCMIVSGKDITDRKKIEDELIESKERFELAMEASKDGIFDWNLVTNEIYYSPGWKNILGYADNELPNDFSVWENTTNKEDVKKSWELQQKLISKEVDRFEYEFKMKHKNGHWVDILSRAEAFFDDNNKAIRIVGTHVDITDRKKEKQELIAAKEKAKESDRLKSAFLSNMSHEIRTPMNGILGFTGLLKEPKLTGDKKDKYIQVIEKSGNRMLNTINDIIDISRIQAGQVEIVKTEVSANKTLDELYHFFYREAEQKGIELIFKPDLSGDGTLIFTDKNKLEAILINLIKNAIKFTMQGSVTFGYLFNKENNNNELIFYVKDTGIGIHPDRKDSIFNRFEQADIEDKLAHQGSGLGLSISKSYAEMLGGRITLKSIEGEGSTFFFYMPYIKPKSQTNTSQVNSNKEIIPTFKKLSVIVAEDDEVSISFFETIFAQMFDNIIYVTNGQEAVNKCRENPETDIILMDIKMPKMNGYDATRAIRKFNKDVIIIAQTAHAIQGDKEKALATGFNGYISKPINKELLFKIISINMGNKSLNKVRNNR